MYNSDKKLREKRIKVTPQRAAILEVLNNTKEHPGVEEIYKRVKKQFPSISLATVYKTVELFVRSNLIQELCLTGDVSRYDANIEPHPHVTCMKCGRVDDIYGLSLECLIEPAEKATGYKLLKEETMYFGFCLTCKKQVCQGDGSSDIHSQGDVSSDKY
ncbi:Fur family transcriptional regulator [Candidatus Contubernalis alkaliaceticus]|uniref:Fur family transcriptional regulator n=1 Tax=Candidatus Contubernalis alkaliaceticus TaxID=338645 RepID=UPI001F4C24A7|nr:Fur family transcriptional regulator [Candidatus Contubernalis alkalaceticus]UNC91888.1 transcriptional repressor [Candidatus Contubernalis alkalaceticus]